MDIYVARQPIFNRKKGIYGYELLFRDGVSNVFPDIDGNTATSKVLSNSFLSIGIEQLTGNRLAFINFTEELLVRKVPVMFPRESLMVEVLEDVEPGGDVIAACREISKEGYRIALDDFFYRSDLQPLVELAQIIKIDFMLASMEEIKDMVDKLAVHDVRFLAEKVETHEEFQQALDMGFEYFQGYFFSKPEIMKGRDIPPSKVTLLQIMAEANKESFEFDKLEKLILQDVSISYKLLRFINSAYFRRIQEISSIKQAIIMLGEIEVRRFISLMAMADLGTEKPDELIRASIIRARLCELLGRESHSDMDESELFTLGLFSLIDAIFDQDMESIMERLPLSEAIKRALLEGKGELADYLNLASSYEKGDWSAVSGLVTKIGVAEEKMAQCYMDAVGWADSMGTI